MTAAYAGICVGGPMAGRAVARPTQRLVVQTYDAGKLGEPTPGSAISEFAYNWLHTGAQGFWIPEGETLHDAINTLAVVYVEKCDAERDK